MRRSGSLLTLCLALAAVTPVVAGSSAALQTKQIAAEVQAAMDRTADPCTDFYRYACGGWLDTSELPPDRSRWTRSFSVIDERNREVVRGLLEAAARQPGEDPDSQRLGSYYGSCMDEEAVESARAKPLEPLLELAGKVSDAESMLEVTGRLHRKGIDVFFSTGVFPDFKNTDLNIACLFQGGLGMPDRDYYVSEDDKKQQLLEEYEGHVARMFAMIGDDEEAAARHAAQVLAFETELAKVSRPRQEMRDLERLYNKLDIGGLQELTPKLPWKSYLAGTGYPEIQDISVATPEFFERLQELLDETDPAVLQTYVRWHVVKETAPLLSSGFVDAAFEFFRRKLAGQQEIQPRWKRCGRATESALGESVGRLYVDLLFSGSSKEVASEMIHDIEVAFEGNLPGLAWMDDDTRGRAMQKVGTLQNKIGYPDEWRDYSSMKLVRDDYFSNAMAGREFEFDRLSRKIGKPVDRKEWGMSPQQVNAYYNPLWNEIVFPAGILQPPFFNKDFPAAMNYGGIGGVIGHELTHGFDDQGRKFDPKGRLEEWWEPEVAERFESQAQCVDDFYSAYEVEPGVTVNGRLTLGENIADIGGVKQAYQAYKQWEERHEATAPAIEGLTNDQLFFVAWGQVWCTLASKEYERLQVTTDPHSPAKFRVQGPVSHNPAFARAFGCSEESPMQPENQCVVW